jgi:hypothetical protein
VPLALDEITAISLDVIRQHAAPLELVGLMASEGGSERVEIMVTVKGCHAEPCRLLLNLSRADRGTLEAELRKHYGTLFIRSRYQPDPPGTSYETDRVRAKQREQIRNNRERSSAGLGCFSERSEQ